MIPALTQGVLSGGKSLITWPGWATNYVLESRGELNSVLGGWSAITNGVTLGTNGVSYTLGMTNHAEFFRLRSQ